MKPITIIKVTNNILFLTGLGLAYLLHQTYYLLLCAATPACILIFNLSALYLPIKFLRKGFYRVFYKAQMLEKINEVGGTALFNYPLTIWIELIGEDEFVNKGLKGFQAALKEELNRIADIYNGKREPIPNGYYNEYLDAEEEAFMNTQLKALENDKTNPPTS